MADEDDIYAEVRRISTSTWTVQRTAEVDEVVGHDGSVRWRVKVRDEGRSSFITKFFNRPDIARSFAQKVKEGTDR